MTFLVITHVVHNHFNGAYYAYGPYCREMNLWIKGTDKVVIIAPLNKNTKPGTIELCYQHPNINFIPVSSFDLLGIQSVVAALFKIPFILLTIFLAMRKADHIHIRCPGNMGLLGLFVQVLFPSKKKTVKYAGEWHRRKGEHRSYNLQKVISKNTFLSRNIHVLVYGHWPDFTKNCVSFFTASYRERDRKCIYPRSLNDNEIRIIFVGKLDEHKRPGYSIEAVSILRDRGLKNVMLDIIGDGPHRGLCIEKIAQYGLDDKVVLHGNVPTSEVAGFLNRAHLLLFLSGTEGWPKVVAESMWWGCLPVTTAVSCVPWMVGNGSRGLIVDANPAAAADAIIQLLNDPGKYGAMQSRAVEWSREYTLDRFEKQVKELI